MMENSADAATHTLRAEDAETWMEPGKHPKALFSVKKATQDAIQGVLRSQAAATPFAQWCTWAVIKHYRLRINILAYRKGELKEEWDEFMSRAGKLLVRACNGKVEDHPTVEEQDELRTTERLLTMVLMTRSVKLRLIACKLNLALVLEMEAEYGERLPGMDFWDTVRVRKVIEAGRMEMRTKWIEFPDVEDLGEEEREMLRPMESGRDGLLEGFDKSEKLVKKFEGSYLADITNCPPKIQERRRVEVVRRGENVAPVRQTMGLRVLENRR